MKVGHRNDREVEVVSGLAPGDRLVAYPSEDLDDGANLEVREASPPAG